MFNLLPAPLDGGRVFKALFSMKVGCGQHRDRPVSLILAMMLVILSLPDLGDPRAINLLW